MIYIVNIEKAKNEKLGLELTNIKKNIYIHNINEYPNSNIRDKLLIGDRLITINGIKCENAIYTAKHIINTGPYLSLCIERIEKDFFG